MVEVGKQRDNLINITCLTICGVVMFYTSARNKRSKIQNDLRYQASPRSEAP